MEQKPSRAAIYTRVSSDQQEINGTSLDTQLVSCRVYASDHGYAVVGEFTDTHTGAEYRERPGLSRLRELVRANAVDIIIVHALDRLSRNQAHIAILIEELSDHDARLELVTEDFEDSAVGRFIMSAKAFAAEIEREKITERTTRGLRARVESGKPLPGCKAKYGYQWADEAKSRMEINPAEAPVVQRIFRECVAGSTLRQIAAGLTTDAIPTPAGRREWAVSTIRVILREPGYTGKPLAWRWQTSGSKRNRKRWERPADEVVALPEGVTPVIVDDVSFSLAQHRLERNRLTATRNNQAPERTLLRAGFIFCGVCKAPMGVANNSNPPHGQYRCSRNGHVIAIKPAIVDEAAWRVVRRIMTEDGVLRQAIESMDTGYSPDELALVDRNIAAVDRQRANLTRSIANTDDSDTADMLLAQMEQLADRRRGLLKERALILKENERYELSRKTLDDLEAWRIRMAANLDKMGWKERRDLLDVLGIRVRVWPATHQPRWDIVSEIIPDIVCNTPSCSADTSGRG